VLRLWIADDTVVDSLVFLVKPKMVDFYYLTAGGLGW
jgi:hypothetical protein